MRIHRRTFLRVGTGAVLGSTLHSWMQKPWSLSATTVTQANPKISIGYRPVVAGLPLYLALEKGYFKQAGLKVEAVKFSEEQQAVDGLMTGQIQGVANGVGSDNLATGESSSPGLLKIIASNTIGGTLNSPWFGGSAALNAQFFKENPETAQTYIDVYRRAIASIRQNPEAARQYLEGYTEITGGRAKAIPLPEYKVYDEFTSLELDYFQRFFDLLPNQEALGQRFRVSSLLFRDMQVA